MSKVDVAIAVIQSDKGRYLLGRRPEGKPLGGKWELPGGKIDNTDGGVLFRAVEREVMEELGISSKEWCPTACVFTVDVSGSYIPSGRQAFYFCGSGDLLSESIKLTMSSHTSLGWFTLEEVLKKDLCPVDRFFFENFHNAWSTPPNYNLYQVHGTLRE